MGFPEGLKVALVHDWLTDMRGGERVLEECLRVFPQAELFTLLHIPGRVSELIEDRPIHTSFLQRVPDIGRRYRYFLPLFPLAVKGFDLSGFDIVLSISHAVAKAAPVPKDTLHVCYFEAPMRYMWDGFKDYFGPGRARLPVRIVAHMIRHPMQRWDRATAARVNRYMANSRNSQSNVRRIYGRQATVVYPPVSLERFAPRDERGSYYLMVGAFAPNKRVHHAVIAFSRLGLQLKIVGSGQMESYCRQLAGETITFLGELENDKIAELYAGARAFVFPGTDDFGITPVEAQAAGTPVIAHASGGALETVTAQTGIFYDEATAEGLEEAVREFEKNPARFKPADCARNAARFGRERFRAELSSLMEGSLIAFRAGTRIDPGRHGEAT